MGEGQVEKKMRKRDHGGCGFCKKNGEVPKFYLSHRLKDDSDRVVCPVLSNYTCPKCKIRGSHTASYCRQKAEKPASGAAIATRPSDNYDKIAFIIRSGYTAERLELIKWLAYDAEYFIIQVIMKSSSS